MYIDFVALTTYVSLSFNWFPDITDFDGAKIDWLHFFGWSFTTPAMIFLLGTLGTSMEDKLINNWPLVIRAIVLDECMLALGFASKVLSGHLRWYLLATSFAVFALLCRAIGAIIADGLRSAGSLLDSRVLKALEWITYLTWSVFGILQVRRRTSTAPRGMRQEEINGTSRHGRPPSPRSESHAGHRTRPARRRWR